MLKRSLGLYPTPPIVECIDIVQPASVPIREMWQLGRDMIDRSEMDRDPVGQSRSMTRQACQQFLATLQVCWHCLARRENCFNSLLDLQDLWVKALLHIVLACKTPVTPGGVSTALPRSCLIFQSTVRTQENHDIFREKLSVTASLQRPRLATELSWRSIARPYGVHGGDSLRSHGAFSARPRRSHHMRRVFVATALTPC